MNSKKIVLIIYILFIAYTARTQILKSTDVNLNNHCEFIENKGQIVDQDGNVNNEVLYIFNYPGLNIQLRKDGFSYDSYTEELFEISDRFNDSLPELIRRPKEYNIKRQYHRVDIKLADINPSAEIIAYGQSQDYANYYTVIGKPEGVLLVHSYQRVLYKNIYPGIDLEFKISENTKAIPFEYNFILNKGADINQIQMACTGAPVSVSENGTKIKYKLKHGELEEEIPNSWYEVPGKKETALVQYYLKSNNVLGLKLSNNMLQNKDKKLIIDPVPNLLWATYYGGGNIDGFNGIALDSLNNLYATGITLSSNNIATSGAYQTTYTGAEGSFLVKMNNNGARQWATYCCGGNAIRSFGITLDENLSAYITGETTSTFNIATSGSYQNTLNGIRDGFIMKFSENGLKLWGTYLGGDQDDRIFNSLIYSNGNIIASGITTSSNSLSTINSFQENYGGFQDAFLAKIDTTGSVSWITYFGGTGEDEVWASSSDVNGDYLICGATSSTNVISTSGAFQVNYGGGLVDGFIAKFSKSGNRIWSTYYGIGDQDLLFGIQSDKKGYFYTVGTTTSFVGLATTNSYQLYNWGNADGIIAKFDSTGHRMWASYYGGTDADDLHSVCILNDSTLILVGGTKSSSNISTSGTYQSNLGGNKDCFIACFNTSGTRNWCTYFGGNNDELPWHQNSCSVGKYNDFYICGTTLSSNGIATLFSHQSFLSGIKDGFIARFSDIDCSGFYAAISNQNNISCHGETDGSATVTPYGGLPPYTYYWNPLGCTDSTVTNLAPGNYTIMVNDSNGCQSGSNITITEPLSLFCYSLDSLPDNGSCNGSASIEMMGGTPPYYYYWQPGGSTGNYLFNLCTGMYNVTITDSHVCTFTEDVYVPSTLNINNMHNIGTFSVYPNPTSDYINISCNNINITQPIRLKITDITGRTVHSEKLIFDNNSIKTLLITNLADGSYFYEITTNELSYRGKIIVSK